MIVHGAWKSVDGVVKNVSGTLRSANATFRSVLAKLLGTSTFIIEDCHLVIHKF